LHIALYRISGKSQTNLSKPQEPREPNVTTRFQIRQQNLFNSSSHISGTPRITDHQGPYNYNRSTRTRTSREVGGGLAGLVGDEAIRRRCGWSAPWRNSAVDYITGHARQSERRLNEWTCLSLAVQQDQSNVLNINSMHNNMTRPYVLKHTKNKRHICDKPVSCSVLFMFSSKYCFSRIKKEGAPKILLTKQIPRIIIN